MSSVQLSGRFSILCFLYCEVFARHKKQKVLLAYRVSDTVSIAPHQIKGAIDVAHFGSHILKEPFERGGSRQVQRDTLIHCLGIGGVLDYTQHPGLLSSTFCLE